MTSPQAPQSKPEDSAVPKLSAEDFHTYNQMAEHMDLFHNHFRQSWKTLYEACTANQRPSDLSLRQFLRTGVDFCHHLEMHHSIEERYVFPQLGERMPAFRNELELLGQHRQIHRGLEEFQAYLVACQDGQRELRLNEMKTIMDGFGEVLWQHLDDEVRQLGAENMCKYWSLEDMRRILDTFVR